MSCINYNERLINNNSHFCLQALNAGTRVGFMKQQSEKYAAYVEKVGDQLPLLRVPIGIYFNLILENLLLF